MWGRVQLQNRCSNGDDRKREGDTHMLKISFIPMNLQLFAEDSSVGEDVAAPQDTETQTTSTVEATDEATTTDTKHKKTVEQERFYADRRSKLEAEEKRDTDSEAQRTSDREIAKKYGQY